MPTSQPPPAPVVHTLGATWTQDDLGEELAVGPLSALGELDPSGAEGAVSKILNILLDSLEPSLTTLERHRGAGNATGFRFEAHKMQSPTAQLGADRLAAACKAISDYFVRGGSLKTGPLEPELLTLVDLMEAETIRLQRRLRKLLVPVDH